MFKVVYAKRTYPCGELDEDERLPSGVVGGVFSITSEEPVTGRIPGLCIASACRKPRFRLARIAALAGPDKPLVRGMLGANGALANGISVEREVDGNGTAQGSGLSAAGAEE